MTSYCSINDAYLNKGMLSNNDDLDRLAREVNNSKKNKSRDIYHQYRKSSNTLHKGIEAFNNLQNSQIDKGTKVKSDNGFYSAQGEYSSYEPKNHNGSLIKEICGKSERTGKKFRFDSESDGISLDTPSDQSSDESSSFSSMTWDTKEMDKEIKTKSKFNNKKKSKRHKCMDFDLDSIDSLESLDSGESLLRHIRFCQDCKEKVMDLIRKHKSDSVKKLRQKYKQKCLENISSKEKEREEQEKKELMSTSDTDNSNQMPELKEIITVCLIGFLVVIVLDLVMRK